MTKQLRLNHIAAEIARRVPAMKIDGSLNNEQLISGLIKPLIEDEKEKEDIELLKGITIGILIGFLIFSILVCGITLVGVL